MPEPDMEHLELWDYRRRVSALYAGIRAVGVGQESHRTWMAERDALFSSHPQSPIEDRQSFDGLPYYRYSSEFSAVARFVEEAPRGWGEFNRVGRLEFTISDQDLSLPAYWLDAYGGGLFVPFKDQTNGDTTYGGGRYIVDSVKGADLGHDGRLVNLDFNFSYHPSCVHSDRWTCPLAPPESVLGVEIAAGEMLRAT